MDAPDVHELQETWVVRQTPTKTITLARARRTSAALGREWITVADKLTSDRPKGVAECPSHTFNTAKPVVRNPIV